MPKTKKSKKTTKRRNYRVGFPKPIPESSISGIPTPQTVRMIYNDNVALTSTLGIMSSHLFRCGSINDPDYSGIGHRPMGRDTYAALYNHYIVKSCRIRVRILDEAGDTSVNPPAFVGLHLTDEKSPEYTSATAYIESNKGQVKLINQTGGYPTLWGSYSAKKFFNITDLKDNFDRLGAKFGSEPAEHAYFQIFIQALGTGTCSCRADVTIEYVVEVSEPKEVGQS